MESIYLKGCEIDSSALICNKAVSFYNAINDSCYCTLSSIRKSKFFETFLFETEVELPQYPLNDIRKNEPIAVAFDINDKQKPEVLALRDDFPQLPHTNITEYEYPKSLCLYEESYDEIKLDWTAPLFLENIRRWLALSAKGLLHADDQPLEPFLLPSTNYIIINDEIINKIDEDNPHPLKVEALESGSRRTFIVENALPSDKLKQALLIFKGKSVVHGVIKSQPRNLYELHTALQNCEIDLIAELRRIFSKWKLNDNLKGILDAGLILLFEIPLKRRAESEIETTQKFAFLVVSKIKEIGISLGLWVSHSEYVADLIPMDNLLKGDNLPVITLNPVNTFVPNLARVYSGVANNETRKFFAIGLGAIGSQVFMNLLRMGYENWALVDNDIILPHNLSRSAYLGVNVGWEKSLSLQQIGNNLINSERIKAFSINIFNEESYTEEIKKELNDCDVILDMSASISVGRFVTLNWESRGRRLSVFLNPNGCDGVMLLEDKDRKYRLDYLEMVYYRFLSETVSLHDHFERMQSRIRYANTCRDISLVMPQDKIAILSGIFSKAIRKEVSCDDAIIKIWRLDEKNGINIKEYSSIIYEPLFINTKGWNIVTDSYVVEKLQLFRKNKLPNETGGVLLGSYDNERKIVYISDVLPSPPDSQEWPTVYIRGCDGLEIEVNKIYNITDGMIRYIGEWHSHPQGSNSNPSQLDKQAFLWLTDKMAKYGLPGLMMIIGEDFNIYLGEI